MALSLAACSAKEVDEYKDTEVGQAIELTGRANIVALDKTGTVTSGEPTVTDVYTADGISEAELLSVAYSLEDRSEHPLAGAIVEFCRDKAEKKEVSQFKAIHGKGVSAVLSGSELLGGKVSFIADKAKTEKKYLDKAKELSNAGKSPLLFTKDGVLLGIIAVADKIREDSRKSVSELKSLGMRVVMLTGDNENTAREIASEAGINEVMADLLPDEKEAAVRRLCGEGKVIMVGDGINDSPALARADVGIAIGGGTDIAIDSADVVLMRSDLADIPRAVRLGRAALSVIKQNLFWAFLYNALGIPLAAGVFGLNLSPMFGAAAMSLSSFCVVSNALRLNLFKRDNVKFNKHFDAHLLNSSTDATLTNEHNIIKENEEMTVTLKIEGMMCPHCEARVKKALEAVAVGATVLVSHESGTATVTSAAALSAEALSAAVTDAGYEVTSVK